MKTLEKISKTMWINLSLITGIMKFEKGFRLTLGGNGVQFPQTMTKKEIKRILKQAGIAIGGF